MAEARTPAQIEADIARRRKELGATLDEIAVRVHPSTVVEDAKAKAGAAADRAVGGVKAQFVAEDGSLRLERAIPAALVAVAVVGLLVTAGGRRRR